MPLVGHTRGHLGVAVVTRDAGDPYYARGEVDAGAPRPTRELALLNRWGQLDPAHHAQSQARLRQLLATPQDDLAVFCAHDAAELRAHSELTARGGAAPAGLLTRPWAPACRWPARA